MNQALIDPLHPYISMHILHTVLSIFSKVLTRRICLTIKSLYNKWSSHLFLSHLWVIQGWYYDASHSSGLYKLNIYYITFFQLVSLWDDSLLERHVFVYDCSYPWNFKLKTSWKSFQLETLCLLQEKWWKVFKVNYDHTAYPCVLLARWIHCKKF